MKSLFEIYWSKFSAKSISDRREYFDSLTYRQQSMLIESFFDGRWCELCVQNMLDETLDYIQLTHQINLIDLRIQAIKTGRVFLVEQSVWEDIENRMLYYSDFYDTDQYFGGLLVESWGKQKQFYRIRANKNQWR